LKIEIWMDLVCPFSYIGKKTLDRALKNFEHSDEVEVEFLSYQLFEDASNDESTLFLDYMAKYQQLNDKEAKKMKQGIVDRAEDAGIHYDLENMKVTNTLDAHRVFQYAKTQGKGNEFVERAFQAHFTESHFLGNHNTLVQLASEIGLKEKKVREVLNNAKQYLSEVQADEKRAREDGVPMTPFFVFDEEFAVTGAQPYDAIYQVLQNVWEHERN